MLGLCICPPQGVSNPSAQTPEVPRFPLLLVIHHRSVQDAECGGFEGNSGVHCPFLLMEHVSRRFLPVVVFLTLSGTKRPYFWGVAVGEV